MKFQCVNELDQLSFDDAGIGSFHVEEKKIEFTFQGALVKAKNSQNARYQDMYCGEIVLQLENAEIARLVKEGMKYYDADGNLQREIPDEDVPAPAQAAVLKRLAKGTVFTVVHDDVKEGYAAEFGIDVPKWQGNFDFAKAKSEGLKFAILRGAYSTSKDVKFIKRTGCPWAACASRQRIVSPFYA